MRNKLILLGLFALFGVFLLRGGMTGNIISESCCFGPECAPENLCPATGASLERPASLNYEDNSALSAVGLLIIIISVSMVYAHARKKILDEKKMNNQGNNQENT